MKENENDLNQRVKLFNESLIPLLGQFKLALSAQPIILQDGRLSAKPVLIDDGRINAPKENKKTKEPPITPA